MTESSTQGTSKQAMLELLDEEIQVYEGIFSNLPFDGTETDILLQNELDTWREIRSLVEFALNVKNHVDTDWETKENSDE